MDPVFAPEVDNFSSVGTIHTMIVGPMIDLEGEIRGVVQLFNKINPEEGDIITEQDRAELSSILLGLGEIIRAANQQFEF